MRNPALLLLLFLPVWHTSAQILSPYCYELAPLPEAVTNNAVTQAKVGDTSYVYSFMGLDSTKIWSGIHLKAWRLNFTSQQWEELPPVPDPLGGRIAAAASTVKNKIYLIGGYHVAQNGGENSSNKVHRFDPQLNTWLSDGATVPIPIDDHVQAVWRDSLIFVVTGWSNTSNVPNVQIYNPATNTWLAGTSTPNTSDYKAFGASGIIRGDTLFYCGGARDGSTFPATSILRKGYINPNNPAQITWSSALNPYAKGYRMAAAHMAGGLVWLGGSDVTYNYNGIAYNGSGGVPALARVRTYYDLQGLGTINTPGLFPEIMDLRGVAQLLPDYFITVGGMGANQQVLNKVYGYFWAVTLSGKEPLDNEPLQFYPNPASSQLHIESTQEAYFQLIDTNGRLVRQASGIGTVSISTKDLPDGTYVLQHWENAALKSVHKVIVAH